MHAPTFTHSLSRKAASGLGVFAVAMLVMVGLAPSAFAHHSNLSAYASCPATPIANQVDVNYSISSWATGDEGANPDIRVEYRVNGGTWTTGAQLAFPQRTAAQGIYSTSGTFTVNNGTTEIDTLSVRSMAYANWDSGATTRGPWDTTSLTVPSDCTQPLPGNCAADQLPVDLDSDGIAETCTPNPVVCDSDEMPGDTNGNGITDACTPNPVVCDSDEMPVDSNGNGITDGCTPNPVVCDADEMPVDSNGNGITDACTPNPVVCDADEMPVDSNGNGITDACTPNPVVCAAGETAVDANGNGITDACTPVVASTATPQTPTVAGTSAVRPTSDVLGTTQSLPRTGSEITTMTIVALVLLGAGTAMARMGAVRRALV